MAGIPFPVSVWRAPSIIVDYEEREREREGEDIRNKYMSNIVYNIKSKI
jgi:hypothetical protein